MSDESVFKRVKRAVPELGKYILLFGAILFLLLSVRLLMFASESRELFQILESTGSDSYYIATLSLGVYLIALAVSCLSCLFYNNNLSIKWFTLIVCFNILVVDAALLYVSPILTDKSNSMRQDLDLLEAKYDWTHKQVDNPAAVDATHKWDTIQESYQCCGLYSYTDWADKRPASLASNIYPDSCCSKMDPSKSGATVACSTESGLYQTDCLEKIEGINKSFIRIVAGAIWANIILAALGCIVIYSQRKVEESPVQEYKLSRNTGALLFAVIVVCTIIQCVVISQRG